MEKTDKEKAKGTRNSKPKSLMGLQKAQPKHELIAWPPSFFPCGFCDKTFKSAQGLGGHMNVHRRERARLRESPAPSSSSCVGESSANSLLISPSLGTGFLESSAGRIDDKMAATIMGYHLCDLSSPQNGEMTYKSSSTESGFFGKGPIARDGGDSIGLDLEMGLTVGGLRKEDLDLELRLGYP